jgi:transposase-like protein
MPTPSKFTEARRLMVLELLSAGSSRTRAAKAAGIDDRTLARWLEKGRRAHPGGRWHAFYLDVVEAEAHPRLRALTDRREMTPSAAMAYLIEAGEFDPEPDPPVPAGIIQLTLPSRRPNSSGEEEP